MPAMPRSALTSDVIVVNDGVRLFCRDGCGSAVRERRPRSPAGIALMDGYDCALAREIRNAQSQNAIAVLIANTNRAARHR